MSFLTSIILSLLLIKLINTTNTNNITSQSCLEITNFEPTNKELYYECLKKIVQEGQLTKAEDYINILDKNNILDRKLAFKIVQDKISILKDIQLKNDKEDDEFKVLEPAFEWTQDKNNVWIKIHHNNKFKYDLNSTSLYSNSTFSINHDNKKEFTFQVYCIEVNYYNNPIKYYLKLNLLENINQKDSEITVFNNYSEIRLGKENHTIWAKLLDNVVNSSASTSKMQFRIWLDKKRFLDKLAKQDDAKPDL